VDLLVYVTKHFSIKNFCREEVLEEYVNSSRVGLAVTAFYSFGSSLSQFIDLLQQVMSPESLPSA